MRHALRLGIAFVTTAHVYAGVISPSFAQEDFMRSKTSESDDGEASLLFFHSNCDAMNAEECAISEFVCDYNSNVRVSLSDFQNVALANAISSESGSATASFGNQTYRLRLDSVQFNYMNDSWDATFNMDAGGISDWLHFLSSGDPRISFAGDTIALPTTNADRANVVHFLGECNKDRRPVEKSVEVNGLSDAYSSCMDKSGGVTSSMLECGSIEGRNQDMLLNENYKVLMQRLDDSNRDLLRAAQRAWIAFRDADCQLQGVSEGGTLGTLLSDSCHLTKTAERAQFLQRLAN